MRLFVPRTGESFSPTRVLGPESTLHIRSPESGSGILEP
jgi:hypothetical protein